MKTLDEMKKELDLEPVHLMLLANTGSMTVLLEALFGEVSIETVAHEVIEADEKTAKFLEIPRGEAVNYRVVMLTSQSRPLVHATSYAPLSRLESKFKDDIMKQDQPIGKIMAVHRLESRREILGFDWQKAGEGFAAIFSIPTTSTLLKRSYNIIRGGRPLMTITEVFPLELGGLR